MKQTIINYLFLTALLVLPTNLYSQEEESFFKKILSMEDGVVHFTEVVKVEGVSADDLYTNALTWISKQFNNPKSVIQTQEKEAGLIIIKAVFEKKSTSQTNGTLTIQVKEGRYKYDLTDIITTYDFSEIGYSMPPAPYSNAIKNSPDTWEQDAERRFGSLLRLLKKEMSKESDW